MLKLKISLNLSFWRKKLTKLVFWRENKHNNIDFYCYVWYNGEMGDTIKLNMIASSTLKGEVLVSIT